MSRVPVDGLSLRLTAFDRRLLQDMGISWGEEPATVPVPVNKTKAVRRKGLKKSKEQQLEEPLGFLACRSGIAADADLVEYVGRKYASSTTDKQLLWAQCLTALRQNGYPSKPIEFLEMSFEPSYRDQILGLVS